jgi:hypothetical protein
MAIFLLMNAVSVGTFQGPRPWRPLLRERAVRYLTPFAFWCVVYAALHLVHALRHDLAPFAWVRPRMFWAGTHYHLWFMPVALGLSLAVEALRRATLRLPTPALAAGVLAAAPLLLYAAPAWLRHEETASWYQWAWIVPAVPMGVALGRLLALPRTPRWPWLLLGFVAAFAAIGVAVYGRVADNYPLRYAIGSLAIGIGFVVPMPSSPRLVRLRTLSAGIFLCHPLVLAGLQNAIQGLAVAPAAAIVWALAALLAFALQLSPWARFAGEPNGPPRRRRGRRA